MSLAASIREFSCHPSTPSALTTTAETGVAGSSAIVFISAMLFDYVFATSRTISWSPVVELAAVSWKVLSSFGVDVHVFIIVTTSVVSRWHPRRIVRCVSIGLLPCA
jgi:hypothetical protein